MADTYTLISSATAGAGGVASFTFSSIPSTYTDLVIKFSGRGTVSGVQDRILISFNGSSTNYTLIWLGDAAGSAISATRSNWGDNHTGYVPAATATANTFGNYEMYIPNYAGSTNKSVSVDAVMENNSATNYNGMSAGLWSQTAAITSLTLTCSTPNFAQYSTAYLYGIKNS